MIFIKQVQRLKDSGCDELFFCIRENLNMTVGRVVCPVAVLLLLSDETGGPTSVQLSKFPLRLFK